MRTTVTAHRNHEGELRYDIGGYPAPMAEERALEVIAFNALDVLALAIWTSPAQVPCITIDPLGRCPACQGVGTLDEDPNSMEPAPCRYCQTPKGAA